MRWVRGRSRTDPSEVLAVAQRVAKTLPPLRADWLAAQHSRTFCACPPSCPTPPRTGTQSGSPLEMTSAHCFGRLSCSPRAGMPPCSRIVRTAVCSRSQHSRTWHVGRKCSPSRCSCFTCSPTSHAIPLPSSSLRRRPPLHCPLPPPPRHLPHFAPIRHLAPSQHVAASPPDGATCCPHASLGISRAPIPA